MGDVPTKSQRGPEAARLGLDLFSEECVGPKLVLVVKPEGKERLKSLQDACKKLGLVGKEVAFPFDSPLQKHGVMTVQATLTTVQRLAEEHGLHKRLDPNNVLSGPPAAALAAARAGGMDVWRPFHRGKMSKYVGSGNAYSFFSPAEVAQLLMAALCASQPAQGVHSALLAVQAASELESVLCLPDMEDLQRLAKEWKPLAFWRPIPGPLIADYFGVSVAQYFILMHAYTWWLMVPTALGVLSFLWNEMRHRTAGHATDSLAHSVLSPGFLLVVIVWSTVCFSNWRQLAQVSKHNLGQRTLDEDAPTLGSAWHYFKSQGLEVGEEGFQADALEENSRQHVRHVAVVFAMLGLLSTTCLTVGFLLWVGDWVEARTANIVLQNLPIILYMAVVAVFQSAYDRLADWLTAMEGHVTYASHVRSLTIKSAFFQLINYLGWFLYLAFWKRDYALLRSQLLMFFTVKQVLGNFLEFGLPRIRSAIRERSKGSLKPEEPDVVQQRAIEQEWERPAADIGDDYLEVAVLFSAATWFAPIFPLGLLLALAHAISETWGDSYKLRMVTRRPVKVGASEVILEAWLDVFQVIGCLGIVISLALLRTEELGWDRFHLDTAEKVVLFVWLYLQLSIPHTPERLSQHLQQVERLLPSSDWVSAAARKSKGA